MPITLIKDGLAPREEACRATIPAPPINLFLFNGVTTRVGSSLETPNACVFKYSSTIISPMTHRIKIINYFFNYFYLCYVF